MKQIMVIDDDPCISDMLKEVLESEGYQVFRAYSGTEAVMALDMMSGKNCRPDLILLDLMLPGLSGEKVLSRIRDIPVIVISAKGDVEDKVSLLLGGAADYLTKPFDSRELLARISVCLRNIRSDGRESVLTFKNIALDPKSRQVTVQDTTVRLTKTEYAILKLLLLNPFQVISKSSMLEQIAPDTPDCVENSLKVHISNLRRKLREADPDRRDFIEAVWGIGFKLKS